MKNYKQILKDNLTGGLKIADGKRKLETTELLGKELTIADYEVYTKKETGEVLSAFVFKEIPEGFYFGGKVLQDIAKQFIDFQTTDGVTKEELLSTNIKIKLTTTFSQRGRQYTKVTFID